MFRLQGEEFSKLVHREFTEDAEVVSHAGKQDGLFECYTSNHRSNYFDILHFRSGFETDIRVENFRDNTHVSLHFQIAGHSAAEISGVGSDLVMMKGAFNLFNCIEPVSHFDFPRQQSYEYICIGLKPAFFDGLLDQCGKEFDGFLRKSRRAEPFSLFADCQLSDHLQWNALQLLQSAPVPDSIRSAYLKSKVEELTLLSLGRLKNKQAGHGLSIQEKERLLEIKLFLDQHFLDELSLAKISREFLLNEFRLKSGFRQAFGITVFGYIQQKRMEYARELLLAGGRSVGEVAMETGYHTDAAFIRAFRNFFGIPPGKMK